MHSDRRETKTPKTRPDPLADHGFEVVIGLEVHIQVATETKLFCRCPSRFGAAPNTLICPVCLGYPGALPVLDHRAVDQAILLALALGAEVQESSSFDRKSYFYADLPKGYQITQRDEPLAQGGSLPLSRTSRDIALERLHLEEDAGKLLHDPGDPGGFGGAEGMRGPATSRIDFNRSGTALVEIVTAPEISTPSEAEDCLRSLHQVLRHTGTSEAHLEEGGLRCDANLSLRRAGTSGLGSRTEVKNLNSFRHVARALEHETRRQAERLGAGKSVEPETRGFDAATGTTCRLRGKEGAQDYRYFPEPDLPRLEVSPERKARLGQKLPELPWQCRSRFERLGLDAAMARQLSADPVWARYFEAAVVAAAGPAGASPRELARWLCGEVRHLFKEQGGALAEAINPKQLAEIVGLVATGTLSRAGGRKVLAAAWGSSAPVVRLAKELGVLQVRDEGELARWVETVCEEHLDLVAQYRGGRQQVFGFLMGRIMARADGRAEPQATRRLLRSWLGPAKGGADP